MNKIGVFGGTFNPVHKGHEIISVEFYNKFNLDKLLIIPSNIPPHKPGDANILPESRLEMCKICFGKYKNLNNYNIEVSDIEIKKDGVSYTFDTIKALREIYPEDIIYFLAGSDMFLYLEYWHRYTELLGMCVFAVALRNDSDITQVLKKREILISRGYKIELLGNNAFEISSTEIREKIKNGDFDNLPDYLSPEVINYIKERKIYVLQ
ncbi:MAG: nicotinate (nicotinamide) nucleotide adenylyltransferase [Oscillospiraceae bacterium]|nr:nicotinate (nicotinamide) nucleotide adenylyltransferase [Oscillospiraceae bacterium]